MDTLQDCLERLLKLRLKGEVSKRDQLYRMSHSEAMTTFSALYKRRTVPLGLLVLFLLMLSLGTKKILEPLFTLDGYGIDYPALITAVQIGIEKGWRHLYDLSEIQARQIQFQQAFFPELSDQPMLRPFPYPPLLVFLLSPLAYLQADSGLFVWTSCKILIALAAFVRLLRNFPTCRPVIYALVICVPLFVDISTANIEVLLFFGMSELCIAIHKGNLRLAGLCLAALCIKPPVVILLSIALLLTRQWIIIRSAALWIVVGAAVNFIITGAEGTVALLALWRGYGDQTAAGMINIRMLAEFFQLAVGQETKGSDLVYQAVLYGGSFGIITSFLTLGIGRTVVEKPLIFRGLLISMLATLLLSWHSHLHLALVAAPAIVLTCSCHIISVEQALRWIWVPAIVFYPISLVDQEIGYLVGAFAQCVCNGSLLSTVSFGSVRSSDDTQSDPRSAM